MNKLVVSVFVLSLFSSVSFAAETLSVDWQPARKHICAFGWEWGNASPDHLLGGARAGVHRGRLRVRADGVDFAVPLEVTTSLTDYSLDPAAMESHRLRLARALEGAR